MNNTSIQNTFGQPVSSQRELPAGPFPRKYIHCVMNDLQYMVQAVYILRTAGYNAGDIHVMASWDFIDAIEQRSRQQNVLSRVFTRFLSFIDDGLGDIYLREAHKGHHILMVHLPNSRHLGHVHAILTAHYGYLIKYVDTWVVADLLPRGAHHS